MEINREDAEMEFQKAQRKLKEEDFAGAKSYALRAQKLFPELNGLDQLIESLNVLVHSNKGPHGEHEWYGILGVGPSDSRQVIKKSYFRKSRILHLDYSKDTFGAGDAMKLVTSAWAVLSDQESRDAYDMRKEEADKFYDFFKESSADGSSSVPFASRSEVEKNDADKGISVPFASSHFEEVFKNGAEKPPTSPRSAPKSQTRQGSSSGSKVDQMFDQTAANPETPPAAATTYPKPQTQQGSSSRSSPKPKPRGRKGSSGTNPNPQPRKYTKRSSSEKACPATQESFWTICTNCKMRYEYDMIYLNAKLTCPATDCKQFFPAISIPPPKKTYKRKQQSPSLETPKSTKSTVPQDAPGSDPVYIIPKPCTPPILATPVSSVPFSATARHRPLIINPITEIPLGAHENLEEIFSGKSASDGNDLGRESNAASKAPEKGKSVVIEEPPAKEGNSFFWKL